MGFPQNRNFVEQDSFDGRDTVGFVAAQPRFDSYDDVLVCPMILRSVLNVYNGIAGVVPPALVSESKYFH